MILCCFATGRWIFHSVATPSYCRFNTGHLKQNSSPLSWLQPGWCSLLMEEQQPRFSQLETPSLREYLEVAWKWQHFVQMHHNLHLSQSKQQHNIIIKCLVSGQGQCVHQLNDLRDVPYHKFVSFCSYWSLSLKLGIATLNLMRKCISKCPKLQRNSYTASSSAVASEK